MAREVMGWNKPTLIVATTETGLDTGLAVECQVNSAVLTPVPTSQTIPATGCAPATNSPGITGWQLELAWLQDWTKPRAESLSWFAWDNDAAQVWARLIPNRDDANAMDMEGPFFAVSGGFGGTFGDGSAAATSATWGAVDRPEITPATVVPPAAADVETVDA